MPAERKVPSGPRLRQSRRFLTLLGLFAGVCPGVLPAADNPGPDLAHERIIKGYFAGWEKKDWAAVARHLAKEFTFTSPAPDDAIPTESFKAKCWPQAGHIRRFEFVKIIGDEAAAFAIVHVITQDGRIIRNTEYFIFQDGKIRSIEVFFGGTGQGFPTHSP